MQKSMLHKIMSVFIALAMTLYCDLPLQMAYATETGSTQSTDTAQGVTTTQTGTSSAKTTDSSKTTTTDSQAASTATKDAGTSASANSVKTESTTATSSAAAVTPQADPTWTGSGTEADPYMIATAAQLAELATYTNTTSNNNTTSNTTYGKYWKLANDIDLSTVCSGTLGNWTPIGDSNNIAFSQRLFFKGSFDGDGHTISNLYISGASTECALFGQVGSGAVIKGFTLAGAINVASGVNVFGGVACFVNGASGAHNALSDIRSEVALSCDSATSDMEVGGIAGEFEHTDVTDCCNAGTITLGGNNAAYPGGISSNASGSVIKDCYNTGAISVSGTSSSAGGIVERCATSYSGDACIVTDCYNVGSVTAASANGVIGELAGKSVTVSNNYYLTGSASKDAAGATAMSSDDMKAATFVTTLNANAATSTTWSADSATPINSGYPVLTWQLPAATTYAVTVDSAIANGTVTSDKATAAEGDTVTLTVTPATGYQAGAVTYTPAGGTATTVAPASGVYSFTMPASAVTVSATFTAAGPSWTGSGTEADPYMISTAAQLAELATYTNDSANTTSGKYWKLANDIDLSTVCYKVDGTAANDKSWTPIGSSAFSGTFDGAGYTISNLYINVENPSSTNFGLFGSVGSGASLSSFKLMGSVSVSSNTQVCAAGVIGQATGSTTSLAKISDVMNDVDVTVTDSTSSASVHVGGIIAYNFGYCSTTGCLNKGSLSASSGASVYAGGIAGRAPNATTQDCYNAGSVTAATTSTTSSCDAGGIVAFATSGCSVLGCYSVGSIAFSGGSSTTSAAGGVVGRKSTSGVITLTNNYYLTGSATTDAAGATAMSSDDMKAATFVTTLNANAATSTTWKASNSATNSGYPVLSWETLNEPATYAVTVDSAIANGTVTSDKATAAEGDTVTLTVTPATGYQAGAVTYTPAGGTATTVAPASGVYSFTMPASAVTVSATFTAAGPSWTGSGTEADPYMISTAAQLAELATYTNADTSSDNSKTSGKYWKLANDIDLSTVCSESLGSWKPIGVAEYSFNSSGDVTGFQHAFAGTFDGAGHTVSNLYINDATADGKMALFGTVFGGTVENLVVAGSVTTSADGDSASGIVALLIAGTSANSTVSGCRNEARVKTTGSMANASGVVGGAACYFGTGGCTVSGCCNTGAIEVSNTSTSSASQAAGIVTNVSTGTTAVPVIKDCYNAGAVTNSGSKSNYVAGVVDSISTATLSGCYSCGAIAAGESTTFGAVAASVSSATCSNNYYLTGSASKDAAGATAMSSDDMKAAAFVTTLNANAATSTTWKASNSATNSGYPVLSWETLNEPATYAVTVDSAIANGTVTSDKATAAEGDTVTLTVTPATGYQAGAVTYTPAGGTATTVAPASGVYSFTMPASAVTVSATFTAAGPSWTGSGTEADPYMISTAAQLAELATYTNTTGNTTAGKYWKLANDIDLSTVCYKVDGTTANDKSWTPIGPSLDVSFCGSFDGAGHTVSNLYINSAVVHPGLFSHIGSGSVVKGFTVTGSITSAKAELVTGAVAWARGTSASRCTISGVRSELSFSVNSDYPEIGGIAGEADFCDISSCCSSGVISDGSSYGSYAGGIASSLSTATVKDCYSSASITGNNAGDYIGGIVGYSMASAGTTSTVTGCYSIGSVASSSGVAGGILGGKDAASTTTATNNYYLTGSATTDAAGAAAMSSDDMKAATFVTTLNANAATSTTWKASNSATNSGYPVLSWETLNSVPLWTGSGTEADPYLITTPAQLTALATYTNDAANTTSGKYWKLGNDIALTDAFTPIGNATTAFAGTFNGDSHVISGLNVSSEGYAGLFGKNTGTVKSFSVSGTVTSTKDYVGGAVGYNSETGTISDVMSYVTVNAPTCYNVGGIAGFNGCDAVNLGGTYTQGGTILRCGNKGNVTGNKKVGGIVGENAGSISQSFNSGTIVGSDASSKNGVGGIAGRNGNNNTASEVGTIDSCYNAGTVGSAGQKWVGGITGFENALSGVTNCISYGTITAGSGYYNPIIGQVDTDTSAASNNYSLDTLNHSGTTTDGKWDKEAGTQKTQAELQAAGFAASSNLTNFADKTSDYPILTWQAVASTDATLSALSYSVDGGTATALTYDQLFAAATADGAAVTIPGAAAGATIALTPTTTDSSATVTANAGVTLNAGTGTATVTVKSQDGSATKTYTVKFTAQSAVAPTITTQPAGASYTQGDTATALTVAATAGDTGTLSYQWYSNTADSTTGGTAIDGATAATYTPSTNTAGTAYYYCVVTDTLGSTTATATSNTAAIAVARGESNILYGGETVTQAMVDKYKGLFYIATTADGTITIADGLEVTLQGQDGTGQVPASIQCGKDVHLTIQDVQLKGITGSNDINFSGAGVLTVKGTNLIDHDNKGDSKAAIHVPADGSLLVNGSGSLYLYKNTLGAGIGGDSTEANGAITLGDSDSSGLTVFAKGTQTGAVIGNGQSASAQPGEVTINAGTYYLLGKARGAIIGGSGYSSGTGNPGGVVNINGGSVYMDVDWTGAAIGGGGGNAATDTNGGTVYINGGSVRTFIDKNTIGSWGLTSQGVNDIAITAVKTNSTIGAATTNQLALLQFDTTKLDKSATSYTVTVDGKDYNVGSLNSYYCPLEDNGGWNPSGTTASNWFARPCTSAGTASDFTNGGTDTNLYLYMSMFESGTTAATHTVTVNGQNFYYKYNTETKAFEPLTDIAGAAVAAIPDQAYTGSAITPTPEVTLGGKKLTAGTDYTVTYEDASGKAVAAPTAAGTYTLVIAGTGDYAGTVAAKSTFTIDAPTGDRIVRLAGDGALDTMEAITGTGWADGSGGTVIVATDGGYYDALTASALAGVSKGSVLLTNGGKLSSQTASELARIKPSKVIVVGGTGAVTDGVKGQIATAAGLAPSAVSRVYGDSATDTADAIWAEAKAEGLTSDTCVIATSDGFADALSAAPAAYAKGYPIFLAGPGATLSARTLAAIKDAGFTKAVVVGGKGVLPTANIDDVLKAKTGITSVSRYAGDTCFQTSTAVAEWEIGTLGMSADKLAVATADSYSDALCGAALCGRNGSILVLATPSDTSCIDGVVHDNASSVTRAYIFGGTGVLPDDTVKAPLAKALG